MIGFPLFPEVASTIAGQVDLLYFFLVILTAFFTIAIFALIFYFALKFRRRPGKTAEQVENAIGWSGTWRRASHPPVREATAPRGCT